MENRNLFLNDDIDNKTAKEIIEKIIWYNHLDDEKEETIKNFERQPIKLYINSCGGNVTDGWGIVGIIESSKTPVHTYCTGSAMSFAVAVAVSGHKRFATKYTTFMIHDVLNKASGTAEWVKSIVEEGLRLREMYNSFLVSKTNIKDEQLVDICEKSKNWYLSAQQALEFGVVDELI